MWPAWTPKRPSTWQDQSILRKLWVIIDVHGWITADSLREMAGLEVKQPSNFLKALSLIQDVSVKGASKPLSYGTRWQ